MKKRPMFFVLLLSFLFISCENLLSPKDSYNNGDEKTYTITGDINIEGALPNELFNENSTNNVARTGFPTVPKISDSDLNLSVSATNADSGSTIDGIINAEKTQYSIKLQKGKWTITVSGKKTDVVILEGSVTVELNDEYLVQKAEKLILKPKNTGGKGNLSLKLALSIGSFNCGGVKATLSSSEDSKKYIFFTANEGNPASEIDLEFSDISSGPYSFVLEFYETMSSDGSDYECENIIYILNDTVNIFDGLTTNEWSGTGYSEDKTTFTLTQEMITSFAMTTVYVSENGDDSNLGTFFAPVNTIQKAVDKVIAMNVVTASSEENPYKILLLSDIETSSNDSFENNKALVNIEPSSASETPLYLKISKYGDGNATINAERSSSDTGRVMYIGENANVTLQNLILTGGYLTDKNGAGVYLDGGTFTMNGGAVISSDNDVYLANGTTITVTGNLTSTDTVATITPNEYSTTRQVLVAGSGVNFTDKIVNRFLVTQENGNEWYVTVNGNLQNMEKDANGYYLGREPSDKVTTSETVPTEDDDVVLKKVSCSIESYDNMLWIAHNIKEAAMTGNKISFNIKLTKDIEIPSGKWQFSELNAPDYSTIDGQGYSITIKEDVSELGNCAGGLFYKFNNSTVKNLVLKGSITANTSITVNTNEGRYIGALCRSAYGSIFENVMSEVTITDYGSGFAGGLIGRLGTNVSYDASKAMVKNCAVYADVSSTNGIAGGILGAIWEVTRCCTIQDSIYMGEIKGPTVGAIVGINENNNVAKSVLKNIWYCVTNNSSIPLIGTKADTTEELITAVESQSADDIASEAAADLLNKDSDETDNYVWVYDPGSAYPTLKALDSE